MTQHDRPVQFTDNTAAHTCLAPEGGTGNVDRFAGLDRTSRDTAQKLVSNFGKNLTDPQRQLFKDALADAMTNHVGALAKLALPENEHVAESFQRAMDQAGFDVSLQNKGQSHSLTIFDRNSRDGISFSSTGGENGSAPCFSFEHATRDKWGMNVKTHNDLFAVAATQKKLSERLRAPVKLDQD